MKINKINVIYKRSIQMRQFEPVEVSISIEAQIDPTDKADTVLADVKKRAKKFVETEIRTLMEERRASYDDDLEKAI